MTRDLLNPHQRVALTITLRHVERTLRGILDDLVNEEQAILYRSTITLPEDKRPEVERLVETALEKIAWLAQTFDLSPEIIDNTAMLRGPLAILRGDLHDVHAHKLRGFGDVDPDLAAELDPVIDDLIALLYNITRVSQA